MSSETKLPVKSSVECAHCSGYFYVMVEGGYAYCPDCEPSYDASYFLKPMQEAGR